MPADGEIRSDNPSPSEGQVVVEVVRVKGETCCT
jgi:hypothetical protein